MPSFCPVFNCLNSADTEKGKSNSLIVKNNVKVHNIRFGKQLHILS